MRRLSALSVAALVCMMPFSKVYASPPSTPVLADADDIRKLEAERNQAIVHGDAAVLDRLTSSDYSFINIRGELLTKAEIVKNFRNGAAKYQSRDISDLAIRIYGDAAVVTGRAIQKGAENGKDYSGDYRFTRMYVKQDGQWITVALQTTLIK